MLPGCIEDRAAPIPSRIPRWATNARRSARPQRNTNAAVINANAIAKCFQSCVFIARPPYVVIVSLFFCLFFVNTKAIGEITALDWSKRQDLEPLRLALQTSFTAEANHGHADYWVSLFTNGYGTSPTSALNWWFGRPANLTTATVYGKFVMRGGDGDDKLTIDSVVATHAANITSDHQWIDSDETLGDNSGYYIAVAAAAGSGDITITGFMIEYH